MTKVKEIIAKTALYYHPQTFATNWDLNIYRGCAHKCVYCFAQYSHKYLASENFFDEIFVKTNIDTVLNAEFYKNKCQKAPVNICGVSDCYQPLEAQYGIMPKILKLFIKYKNPIVIITKSTLILKDFELIKELSKLTQVTVSTSISTLNEDVRKMIEPGAAPGLERLQMLQKFKDIGCQTNVLLMPIIPYLTDDEDNLNAIFSRVKAYNLKNIIAWPLHLRGNTKSKFFSFLESTYPDKLNAFKKLYVKSDVATDYHQQLNASLFQLRKKYNLWSEYAPVKVNNPIQLALF